MMAESLQTQNITPYLLANRDLMSLKRATQSLVKRVRLATPIGAVEYLKVAAFEVADGRSIKKVERQKLYADRIRLSVDLMELYRELFPREYAASMSPPFSTAREHEFYRLVDLRMFPVELKQIDEDPEFFWPGIPLTSKQPHDWVNGCCAFDELETVYKLALILSDRKPGEWWRKLGITRAPAPPLERIAWSLFVYTCRVQDSPLKFLPFAFYMTMHETGNPWLDVPAEGYMGYSLDWTGSNIARLFVHRTQASEMLYNVNSCSRWLDEKPENLAYAVQLWNEAAKAGEQQ